MAKFIHGFFPNYKLHKVCADDDLRPMFGYLFIKDGNVYATDAHIAIAAPLSFVSNLDDEEKVLLDGKLIHATQFALLLKMRETYVKETKDGAQFECKTKSGGTVIIPILAEEQIGKFPNVESILISAEKKANELDKMRAHVGFNKFLIVKLADAMDAKVIEFYFTTRNEIVTRDQDKTNEIRALLMPCHIGNPKF